MIVAGSASPLLLASAAGGYNLERSLRFRSSASSYLNRTPASAGNRKTWTWSAWVKRGTLGTGVMFSGGTTSSDTGVNYIGFLSDQLIFAGISTYFRTTSQVLRDPSAWYHIVVALDTTQATANNRCLMYINGTVVTAFSTNNALTQNTDYGINQAAAHRIASESLSGGFGNFDGYLTEVNFIDGQALTPSSFGANNAQTGVWQPKKYAGTYGTNGFYLPFTNNSTTTTLGNDFSGNGNNWTTNNISLTAGSTYDSMTDVPTLTSETASNFCVMNPLVKDSSLSNGNLQVNNSASNMITFGTLSASSGKWYFEATITTVGYPAQKVGVARASATGELGSDINGWAVVTQNNSSNGSVEHNGSVLGDYTDFSNGDILNVAFDMDSGKLWFGKNGTWFNSGSPSSGTNALYSDLSDNIFPAINNYNKGGSPDGVVNFNFGQRPFAYTPPTGFVALNTFNLPTPTIGATASTQAGKYFNPVLYTGNGGNQSISGVGFQPDFIWLKARSSAEDNNVYDTVRGISSGGSPTLLTNSTAAETTYSGFGVSAVNSDGFSLIGNGSFSNRTGYAYVAWNWKANGTGVTNTAGSITSTVSANTSAGFSVVTYTGNATSGATVGHGLGATPKMIIVKCRNSGVAHEWRVYHASLGNTKNLRLNTTDAEQTTAVTWNNTSPTSTVFSLGSGGATNESGTNLVAYCFSEIAGYSKFGSYTGNGSTDGTFVYTGFRPKYVMMKRTDTGGTDWILWDAARNPSNVVNAYLAANLSDAETTAYTNNLLDFVSNGFKLRQTASGLNASGGTYIYMAFAENPFKYSLAR